MHILIIEDSREVRIRRLLQQGLVLRQVIHEELKLVVTVGMAHLLMVCE